MKKVLSVPTGLTGPESWEYTISVAAQNGAPAATTMSGKVDQDTDTVTFGPFTYTAPGTYTYTVSETGEIDGVANDENAAGKTVTVTVTDNKDGTLTATADSTANSPLTFTNTYKVSSVIVDPPVKKVIEGTEELYNKGDFTFKIENTVAPEGVTAPMPTNTTIKNIADYELKDTDEKGFYEFGEIEFTVPGTYTYKVTEEGTVACVTNDAAATTGKTITFTVTDNGEGQLVVTPTTNNAVFTFTNVYADVSATVKKVWDDANNQDGKRPESITVTLNNGTVVTLNEENKWSATVDKLPKYDSDHKEIVYTWTEGEMPEGYTLKGDPEVKGTVTTLTNTYEPRETNVSGRKIWEDKDNQDGKRPASITVNLLANGQTVQSKPVTAEDGWAWNFTGLPKYSNGKEITYTVEEDAVEGYTPEVNGYSITNTHEVEKIDVTVTKTWSDYDNQYKTRPQSITVQLYANGKACGDPVTITADNAGQGGKWTYTYIGLDKYEAGEEIAYTVKEEAVSGYTTTYNGLDITNSYVRSNPSRPPKDPDPTPDPVVDPDEPIDDPDTPLTPGTIDEPEEPIDDPDTPLAPYEEETEIDDEATPLTPFTGDDRHTDVWAFLSLLSLAGIVVVARKRREEE